jgi:hypothetical protein
MTFKIAKSVIDGMGIDYPAEVEAFRQAKLAHRFTGDVAPSAPAIIEHAVRRVPVEGAADDFVTDYEVVDDTPPPPTLQERKAALVSTIRSMEAAASAEIVTPARERLMGLDLNEVYVKPDADRNDADRALVAKMTDVAARKATINRHAVLLEIEVEDLNEADIDGWVPAAFPA